MKNKLFQSNRISDLKYVERTNSSDVGTKGIENVCVNKA